jgi:tRNA (guanosine-2'-O-)-methyltransferase
MPKEGFTYEVKSDRGFIGIGIENSKTIFNTGSLWRTALNFNADFIFTTGDRYRPQKSDTSRTPKHIPCWNFKDFQDLFEHLPNNCDLIGVEMDERSRPLQSFTYSDRVIFLLGSEDYGLSPEARKSCRHLVQIPSLRGHGSINVACAGSIVLYDYFVKKRLKNAT